MKLKDKVIIVTGVSKGIGLETVKQLMTEGANVVGWGRKSPKLSEDNFHFIEVDIR